MEKVTVTATGSYDVLIGRDLCKQVGSLAAERMKPSRVLLISDAQVGPLYIPDVKKSLVDCGFSVQELLLPVGEEEKTPARLVEILEVAAQKGLTRSDRFAALGGGVVGDITGLAAGLYLRGVE